MPVLLPYYMHLKQKLSDGTALKAKSVNSIIVSEIYHFISQYYSNITLADYVMDIFSIDKSNIIGHDTSYEKFFNILQYLQKMSGDQSICYHAGKHFSKHRLFHTFTTPGIRFSLQRTFGNIDKIFGEIFPGLQFTIKSGNRRSIILSIYSADSSIKPDYFFSEYLRGIISAMPNRWGLPTAKVTIQSYPFSIEEILNHIDIPYQKKDSRYFIYGDEIAEEESLATKGKQKNAQGTLQIVRDNLYIKDIFIKKNTVLNALSLQVMAQWKNIKFFRRVINIILFVLGIPLLAIAHIKELYQPPLLISLFLLYEVLVLMINNTQKRRELKKIYEETESSLSHELSEQRAITGEAFSNAANRLQSIENLMNITKQIIHEKDIVNLFDNIRKLTAKAFHADRTTVFLYDSENRELRSGPELSDEKQEFKIPEDQGIAGEIFKLKKIVNVKDAYNNPHFNKAIDRQTGYETKTILGAPLLDLEGKLMGVIQILNKKEGEFQKIDEQILETLSTYIATALKDTLTIRELEKRGIDPEIINGFSTIARHIFNEYIIIQNALIEIEDPSIDALYPRVIEVSLLLEKLIFLFDTRYEYKGVMVSAGEIVKSLNNFVDKNRGDKNIRYITQMSIPEDGKFILEKNLLYRAVFEILKNSIESIDSEGQIAVRIYNFVSLPTHISHDLSIVDIIAEFNSYSKENASGFINFLQGRKPFLESDLKIIKDSIKEFIAFEFFDTGAPIEDEIRDKIFHPFFSTRGRFGLGLAIAKTAVTRMGGTIREPKRYKNGKSLSIIIPLARANQDTHNYKSIV
jgi:signal transduction histidine kinase